jgi:monoamine oxidase
VIVVGAGFGGLSTAWQLRQAGADVVVLEARNRVGGRVLSLDRFIPGSVVEGGAELIGSNHPTWNAYARHFGLEFRDVTPSQDDRAPIILDGKRFEGKALADLWDRLGEALAQMNSDAHTVNREEPWKTPDADRLDHMSLAEAAAAWPVAEDARRAALAVLANDDATWPENESYLATLSTIAGGGYEQFWTESEVYRCVGGNQELAFKLAAAVGEERIHLKTPITSIDLKESGVEVRTKTGARFEGDLVVLTVPPAAWDAFSITPSLPDNYRVNSGPAIKYLSKVSRPFWVDDGLHPNSLTDTPVGETWEGTDAQRATDEEPACLSVFSGGAAAAACLAFPAANRHAEFAKYLEAIYPGYNKHFEKAMFMGWPNEEWTRCGYSCPAPGQVTGVFPNLRAGFRDRLFFAGEYASLLFTGYMEGGLRSGAELAQRLAGQLNLKATT